ncbi:MAG: SIMPL domain-containing protein [Parvibaculaceae bacterium]
MDRRSLAALSVAGLAGLALTSSNSAIAQETKDMPRVIQITGHGEVRARPDLAIITIGVMTQGPTARDALESNTEAMERVFEGLRKQSIDSKDMQTTNFTISPRYDYGQNNNGQAPKLVGYDVVNSVVVTVRKIEALGRVLDAAVSDGSNQINGVMFSIADPEPLRDKARQAAVADADRKAKLYADAAKLTLGPVLTLSESGFQPPVPVMTKSLRADGASNVPIAEGEQMLAVDVNITWELK